MHPDKNFQGSRAGRVSLNCFGLLRLASVGIFQTWSRLTSSRTFHQNLLRILGFASSPFASVFNFAFFAPLIFASLFLWAFVSHSSCMPLSHPLLAVKAGVGGERGVEREKLEEAELGTHHFSASPRHIGVSSISRLPAVLSLKWSKYCRG